MASKSDFSDLSAHRSLIGLYVYPEVLSETNGLWVGGGSDEGLTEEGKERVAEEARELKKRRATFRRIVSSPELRAVQAADFIHDQLKLKWATSSEFRDQNLGEIEGQSGAPELRGDRILEPPGGEAGELFLLRVREGLVRTIQPRERVLLVVHPRVARAVLGWMGFSDVIDLKGIILDQP